MAGRHRLTGRPQLLKHLIAWVDLRTNITHLLTPDAAAEGRRARGRYVALCGADVIPAAMTEPGQGNCQLCRSASIPTQRTTR